jgi:hypothetical protein
MRQAQLTHEGFIQAVRNVVATRLPEAADREKLLAIKLTYGAHPTVRGVTYYNQWKCEKGGECSVDFATISAMGQKSTVQLAGTTIHELGHVLTGPGHGHNKDWKDACYRLGLRSIQAAGTSYTWAKFLPDVRFAILGLGEPLDGRPQFLNGLLTRGAAMLPGNLPGCSHGIGSRGGKSRGAGSGSRMLRVSCPKCGYVARVARSWLVKSGAVICPTDNAAFIEG